MVPVSISKRSLQLDVRPPSVLMDSPSFPYQVRMISTVTLLGLVEVR